MDPSELRMNLASLQRIDPFIKAIIMSSPQVSEANFEFLPKFGRKSAKIEGNESEIVKNQED